MANIRILTKWLKSYSQKCVFVMRLIRVIFPTSVVGEQRTLGAICDCSNIYNLANNGCWNLIGCLVAILVSQPIGTLGNEGKWGQLWIHQISDFRLKCHINPTRTNIECTSRFEFRFQVYSSVRDSKSQAALQSPRELTEQLRQVSLESGSLINAYIRALHTLSIMGYWSLLLPLWNGL